MDNDCWKELLQLINEIEEYYWSGDYKKVYEEYGIDGDLEELFFY